MGKFVEALKNLNYDEAKIQEIVEALHKSTEYIPKGEFDEKLSNIKDLKSQIEERNNQLKDLQGQVGDNEELKHKLEELQKNNEAQRLEFEKQLALTNKKNLLKYALNGVVCEGAEDDVVEKMILDNIIIDPNTNKIVSGFEEEKSRIKNERPYYFTNESGGKLGGLEINKSSLKPTPQPSDDNDVEAMAKSMVEMMFPE